ncbi:MAG: DUF61 family protein [Methanomassiliicoccales archaeon]
MFDDRTFQKFVSSMNMHLPVQKRSLEELLKEKETYYCGKDGNRYIIDRKELEYLTTIIPLEERGKLRLPILVMTEAGEDRNAWKVTGKIEVKVIARVLDREPDTEDLIIFYYPHLQELRKKLPTSTTVMFMP